MEAIIEQALYGVAPLRGYGFLAASPGFRPEWKAAAEKLCTAYGERPAGLAFAGALFVLPLVPGQIAIVEVRDQGTDDVGRPGSLEFRILAVPVPLYRDLTGDPFWIVDRCRPDWTARGTLPVLTAPTPPPERTTATLRPILQRDDSPVLLGGVQALLDGSRLFLARTAPDPELVRGLWALLPARSREDFWPCTFTFRPRPEFHVQVAPPSETMPAHALTADQAADYPEGRYELALQAAVEAGDESHLFQLLNRRSRKEMLWLALVLLILFALVPISSALFPLPPVESPAPKAPPGSDRRPRDDKDRKSKAPERGWQSSGVSASAVGEDRPTFPTAELVLPLSDADRLALGDELHEFARRRGIALPGGFSDADFTSQLERLDAALPTPRGLALQREAIARFVPRLVGTLTGAADGHLLGAALSVTVGGAGQLRDAGPIERQLRILLWKHGHPGYRDQGPNTLELLERLESRLP